MAGSRIDDLGLRHAMGARMLPLLVAAMTFLAALALAGALAAQALAHRWQDGAAATLTVQVPTPQAPLPRGQDGPEETRLDRVLTRLRATPGVIAARALDASELHDLLRPWLGAAGESEALPLPAVVAVRIAPAALDVDALSSLLDAAVPGTVTESHGVWLARLSGLARSLQACAWLILALVASVAAAMVMVATQAGLVASRESIEIVHGLGATDGTIAGRFSGRAMRLAALGGLGGAALALPVFAGLAVLISPFTGEAIQAMPDLPRSMPVALWWGVPLLPLGAALIGFLTAQATVRCWLRRLP